MRSSIIAWAAIAVCEMTIYSLDVFAALSVFWMTSRESSIANELIFTAFLLGEPIAFTVAMFKPRLGGYILTACVLFSGIVALSVWSPASARGGLLEGLWFGSLLWGPKCILAWYFVLFGPNLAKTQKAAR